MNLPHMESCKWVSTELVNLPLDMSEMTTPATVRAAGRGYQAGMAAGFAAGYAAGATDKETN
jgi:hypothetical protein